MQIYRLNASRLKAQRSGRFDTVEDFVPVSDDRALVTAGPGFRSLTTIAEVSWQKQDSQIVLYNEQVLRTGQYLRLGHYANGQKDALIYSEGFMGPHQPFLHGGHIYWTNDAPNGRIYRDGRLFIGHWPGVVEVTNPWVTDDAVYFEARDEGVESPQGWWVWKSDHQGFHRERIARGANPCIRDGTLYYGSWNEDRFDIVARSY